MSTLLHIPTAVVLHLGDVPFATQQDLGYRLLLEILKIFPLPSISQEVRGRLGIFYEIALYTKICEF